MGNSHWKNLFLNSSKFVIFPNQEVLEVSPCYLQSFPKSAPHGSYFKRPLELDIQAIYKRDGYRGSEFSLRLSKSIFSSLLVLENCLSSVQ